MDGVYRVQTMVDCFCRARFSAEQLYHIVQDVNNYKHFIPWCTDSKVLSTTSKEIQENNSIKRTVDIAWILACVGLS
jgi:ribosome-associated toxin RatA of RatAB toxin-antitoxin module